MLAADDLAVAAGRRATAPRDRTEGWPAGMRLAALFLGTRDPTATRRASRATTRPSPTTWSARSWRASRRLQRFLLRTSIAERLSSGLAEALTDESHGQQHLEALESSNAFVVGLGPGPGVVPLPRAAARGAAPPTCASRTHEHSRTCTDGLRAGSPATAARSRPCGTLPTPQDWRLLGRIFVTGGAALVVSADRAAVERVLHRIPRDRLDDGPDLAGVRGRSPVPRGAFRGHGSTPRARPGGAAPARTAGAQRDTRDLPPALDGRAALARRRGRRTPGRDHGAGRALRSGPVAARAPASTEPSPWATWGGPAVVGPTRRGGTAAHRRSRRLGRHPVGRVSDQHAGAPRAGRDRDRAGWARRSTTPPRRSSSSRLAAGHRSRRQQRRTSRSRRSTTAATTSPPLVGCSSRARRQRLGKPRARRAFTLAGAWMDASAGRLPAARARMVSLATDLDGGELPPFLASLAAVAVAQDRPRRRRPGAGHAADRASPPVATPDPRRGGLRSESTVGPWRATAGGRPAPATPEQRHRRRRRRLAAHGAGGRPVARGQPRDGSDEPGRRAGRDRGGTPALPRAPPGARRATAGPGQAARSQCRRIRRGAAGRAAATPDRPGPVPSPCPSR